MQSPIVSTGTSSAPIDLQRVRQLFSRPERLVASSFLRREVANRMHERLALIKLAPKQVLDAGCGEGADLPLLQQRFADAHVLGLDAAPAMLDQQRRLSQGQQPWLQRWLGRALGSMGGRHDLNGQLIAGDFANLPLAAASLDAIWSNLALHWHPHPDLVLSEWQRVLRVQGLLMFSCFGPDTFGQLRNAARSADLANAVLPFVDMHDFGDMLVGAGFASPVMDMEKITVTYRSTQQLIADVRAFGGNPLFSRQKNLRGRCVWRALQQALEGARNQEGVIPLSFEIIYGHAFKPQPKTPGEAVIHFDWPRKSP